MEWKERNKMKISGIIRAPCSKLTIVSRCTMFRRFAVIPMIRMIGCYLYWQHLYYFYSLVHGTWHGKHCDGGNQARDFDGFASFQHPGIWLVFGMLCVSLSVCVYMYVCMYVCMYRTWADERNVFIFTFKEFVRRRSVLCKYEHCISTMCGHFKWDPKNKIAIFSKRLKQFLLHFGKLWI
jgi:hypothetical protein